MTITISMPKTKLKRLEKRAQSLGVSSQHLAQRLLEQMLNKSESEFDSWIETYEVLADTQLMKAIRQSKSAHTKNKARSWEEVKRSVRL